MTKTTKPVQLTFKAFNTCAETGDKEGQFVLDGRHRDWDEVGVRYTDFMQATYSYHIDFESDRIRFYDDGEGLWLHPSSFNHKVLKQLWTGE